VSQTLMKEFALSARLLDARYRPLHHALYIGLICFFWFLFSFEKLNSFTDYVKLLLYASTYIVVAYLNIYVLFPRLLLAGKPFLYVLTSLVTFVISYAAQNTVYVQGCGELMDIFTPSLALFADMGINAITYCMFIGIGLSFKYIRKWVKSELRIVSLEKENLRANLNSLRSQVSPHFLFNTFNNLYVLTKTNPALAGEMLLGFADLMRYQLNECQNEKVDLEQELSYIANLLSLEKLRKNHLDLKINYDTRTFNGIQVEPLLFVSLVENAVKHGSQLMERPFIHVDMQSQNGLLAFEVVNSIPVVAQLKKTKSLGKGIENLRRRLQLSYPDKHTLVLREHPDKFSARLEIQFS
jgi:two-component system LytT family sensor kinase